MIWTKKVFLSEIIPIYGETNHLLACSAGPNHCPTTFLPKVKNWGTVIWFICLRTGPSQIENTFWYLVRDIKPSNNQFCFPHFFPRIFVSFSSWKRKETFYWSKTVFFCQFWTNEKFVFFSNWEKCVEKIWENKIGCLVVWCHEQDMRLPHLDCFIFKVSSAGKTQIIAKGKIPTFYAIQSIIEVQFCHQ